MKRSSGRPTKYNEGTLDRLCDALADGLPQKSACAVAGIGPTTLSDWRKRHLGLEQRIKHALELAHQKTLRKKGILEPARQTLPPSNSPTRQLNYAGQPMKPGDKYGGRP